MTIRRFAAIAVAAAVATTSLPLASQAVAAPIMPVPTAVKTSAVPMADVVEVKHKRKLRKLRKLRRKAKRRKIARHHKRRYRVYRHYDPGPFIAGTVLGAIIASEAPVYVHRRSYVPNVHIRYCYNRYRSYRAWDNSFQPYHGPRRACRSPYWP